MGWVVVLLACMTGLAERCSERSRLRQWRQQINSWWRIIPVIVLVWLIYPWGLYLLIGFIGYLSWRELFSHAKKTKPVWQLLGAITTGAYVVWLAVWPSAAVLAWTFGVSLVLFFSGIKGQFLLWCLYAMQAAGLSFLVMIHQIFLSEDIARSWFLYLVLITAFNDVAQFINGKLFGRHRLAQNISPNKTWQGVIGGLISSVLISITLAHTLSICSVAMASVLGVLLSTVGILGDLFFSMAKRRLGIKDFSNLLPGHGGMLDRVDSLVFTTPVIWLVHVFLQSNG